MNFPAQSGNMYPFTQLPNHRQDCCIAVWYNYSYTYTCRNIVNNNDEGTHFFRKIYLSHFIRKGCKRVVCERWFGDWTDCNILTPSSSFFSSFSISFCWAPQPGILRAQALCWELVITTSVIYWPSARPNRAFQSDAPEGIDTFQWPVIERNRVGRFGWRNGTR